MNYWNHVLWSDDTKRNLFGSEGVQHVWRRPGEHYQEDCILPTVIVAWLTTSPHKCVNDCPTTGFNTE